MKKGFSYLIIILFILAYVFLVCFNKEEVKSYPSNNIPEYSGEDIIILNNNEPDFDDLAKSTNAFEVYGELDDLGRCTAAYANLGVELMPTSSREDISSIKPTGWHSKKYDIIPEDGHLYNRCHLIAFQLAGENANPNNLITCTRYTNSTLMIEYEEKVGNYIRRTKNHVLYRVTPIFDNDNLIAKGIQMEALSIEDEGKGIKFNIFVYNVYPGIEIDYKTGYSKLVN